MRLRVRTLLLAFLVIVAPYPAAASARAATQTNGSTIDGIVLDALGRPIAGANVLLEHAGKPVVNTRTGPNGAFHFGSILGGNYLVDIFKVGFKSAEQIVEVPKSDRRPLIVPLESVNALALNVVAQRLNHARNELSPETGSTAYSFDKEAIHRLPQGANANLSQVLVQAPGVSQDAYGQGQEQIHIHGENGGGIQYRFNNVFLPEAVSSFGELFSPRFVQKLTLLTGVLPSQFGFRNEGVIDIHTKDGCLDRGGSAELYGGQRAALHPSFEYGGCEGKFSYFVSGFYLQNSLGLPSPTPSPDPAHDFTRQGQGFSYFSYYPSPTIRLSLLAGTAISYFQIPPEPGLAPVFQLNGVRDYPSAAVKESELEQNYYQIMSLQGTAGSKIDYQIAAFTRYYALTFTPDRIGDLIYNGVAARIFHSGLINGTQGDFAYSFASEQTLRAGFYLSGETIEVDDHALIFPAINGEQSSTLPIRVLDDHHQVAWLLGFYGQDEWRPLPHLKLSLGLRWDWMSAFVVQNQWSPRIGFDYEAFPGTVFHGGYARYFKIPPLNPCSSKQSINSQTRPMPPQ
jgi:TonB dependent receptor/Carboxypeptidase regulatory-like domain